MMGKLRLFLDASVFIAAAGSPQGGSSAVLELCRRGHFYALCTRLVLLEAERNITRKMGREALLRFYRTLAELEPILESPPTAEEIAACEPLVGEKDAHVLAAALKSGADVLLTLDRKHFMTEKVSEAGLKLRIATPGDFLKGLVEAESKQ